MTSGPDIDQLEATATEAATTLLHVGAGHTKVWTPHELAKRGKAGIEAVSDLAARARDNDECDEACEQARAQCEIERAERRRLARRVAELEQERMSKESGRALIEDANRWEQAYRRERDRVAELQAALRQALEHMEFAYYPQTGDGPHLADPFDLMDKMRALAEDGGGA